MNNLLTSLVLLTFCLCSTGAEKPNVLLIMTDDQGYGDLGAHGNPKIRTPTLDAFAQESLHVPNFLVCPVCSPTRASLMTGRYHYRTGIVDTYLGRSMMHGDEVTLAELLGEAGYRTGIFGKWHLGDNYPMRPQDQGFQEVLVHRGGGIGQPADPPGNSYFDPILQHNGQSKKFTGYCSDIFTDGTIDFIKADSDKPFFAYLAFNCPHTPLQVPEDELKPYLKMDLSKDEFPSIGYPLPGAIPQETTARVYGMVTNIDRNLKRLFRALDEAKLAENTIVIFLTDNGPQQVRYNAGLRDRKGSVYEGGIRVPFYIRWPGKIKPGEFSALAAHIDILPTLLAACDVEKPEELKLDGMNMLPDWLGVRRDVVHPTVFLQWHRGDEPQLYRAFTARGPRYKLVQAAGRGGSSMPKNPQFELYEVAKDPYELNNIADQHPDIVKAMKADYEQWFKDVGSARGYAPPRIYLGTEHENPVTLTRQDWRGKGASWSPKGVGHWEVSVRDEGPYEVTLRFNPAKTKRTATLRIGEIKAEAQVEAGADSVTFALKGLPRGDARLGATLSNGDQVQGVNYVDVRWR